MMSVFRIAVCGVNAEYFKGNTEFIQALAPKCRKMNLSQE